MENLIRAQFVREYSPYTTTGSKKTKTKLYKLTDPFLIFYFRYIHKHKELIEKNKNENLFYALAGASLPQYFGFAFERLCEDSFDKVRKKLDLELADILNAGPYFQQKTIVQRGIQIDNLIRRRDKVWMVVEYKFSEKPIGKEVISEVERKIEGLKAPPQISVEKVLVSAFGTTKPLKDSGFFDSVITLKDLFE